MGFGIGIVEMVVVAAILAALIGGAIWWMLGSDKGPDE
jgi:hypothetical protein